MQANYETDGYCGHCPMSEHEFRGKVLQSAISLVDQLSMQMDVSPNDRMTVKLTPRYVDDKFFNERTMVLIDGDISCGGFLLLQSPESRRFTQREFAWLRRNLVDILKAALFPTRRRQPVFTSYSAELHLILWSAVMGMQTETLTTILRCANMFIPDCDRLSLLLKSIEIGFEEGCAVLVQFGAPIFGELGIKAAHRPVYFCVWQIAESLRNRGSDDRTTRQASSQALCRILYDMLQKALPFLQSVAYSLFSYPNSRKPVGGSLFSTLWFVVDVAFFHRQLARLLIDIASPQLNIVVNNYHSPMFSAILALRYLLTYPQPSFSLQDVAVLINHGVLSLLRAGARCHFSVDAEILQQICGIVDRLPPQFLATFLTILVECQVSPENLHRPSLLRALRRSKMCYQIDDTNFWSVEVPWVPVSKGREIDVLALLNNCFPRSLQAMARQSILNQLPLGFTARRNAIRMLPVGAASSIPVLQETLLKYLDFADLKVKVE